MFRNILLTGMTALGIFASTSAAKADNFRLGLGINLGRPGLVIGSPIHDHHYHVQYRDARWQEKTFFNFFAAKNFERDMELRGYQAQTVNHGGHFDVRFRMLDWRTYTTVGSDREAHRIEHYLESRGYDARVVHH